MKCEKCGQLIDQNLQFCPHCGNPINGQVILNDPNSVNNSNVGVQDNMNNLNSGNFVDTLNVNNENQKNPDLKSGNPIKLAIIIVIIIIVIIAGIFIFKDVLFASNSNLFSSNIIGDVTYNHINYKVYSYDLHSMSPSIIGNYVVDRDNSQNSAKIRDFKGNVLFEGELGTGTIFFYYGVDGNLYYYNNSDRIFYKLNGNKFEKIYDGTCLTLEYYDKNTYTMDRSFTNNNLLYGLYTHNYNGTIINDTLIYYIEDGKLKNVNVDGNVVSKNYYPEKGHIVLSKDDFNIYTGYTSSTGHHYAVYDIYNNKMIIDYNNDYYNISFLGNDRYVVSKDKKSGVVDSNNNILLPFEYNNIYVSQDKQHIIAIKSTSDNDENAYKVTIYDLNLKKEFEFAANNLNTSSMLYVTKHGDNYILYSSAKKQSRKDTNSVINVVKKDGSISTFETSYLFFTKELMISYLDTTRIITAYDENMNEKYKINVEDPYEDLSLGHNETIMWTNGSAINYYDITNGSVVSKDTPYVEAFGNGFKILHEDYQVYLYINNEKTLLSSDSKVKVVKLADGNYYVVAGSKFAYVEINK